MTNLAVAIEYYLDRSVDFDTEVILRDDGNGVFISTWNAPEPQPTRQQLEVVFDDAVAERNQTIQAIRQAAQSTVGQHIGQLDNNQIKALLIVMLRQHGAISNKGTIKPLSDWT